jgi:septal ring factor EnvC (AmiA/AmiB activator)
VRVVAGTYADYVEALERRARGETGNGKPARTRAADAPPAKPAPRTAPPRASQAAAAAAAPAESHADRKRKRNEISRLESSLKKLEAKLAELETRRSALHAQVESDAASYRPELYTQIHEIERDIAHVEQEWLETGERMQSLAAQ